MTRTSEALPDDLLAPDVNEDPHPAFRALREQDPVHWSDRHRAWLVTRFDDCSAALSNYKQLSSNRVQPLLDAMDAERRAQVGPVYEMITGWMVVTDPPEHRRLRKITQNAFNPRRVAAMEGKIQALIDDLLDRFVEQGSDKLVADFTYPLPATVIAELIGAPAEDAYRFKDWSNALAHVAFGVGGDERDERHARALEGLEQMMEYFGGLLEVRRGAPGEDMISDLLAGDDSGQQLTDDEIKSMCALMLFAGHETTTSTIASAVVMLIQHPDQLELLRSDPDGLAAGAAEEALRYEGAIKVLHRWVVEDLELRGRQIRKGDRVFILPAAANRDPEKFEDPERVDITRSPNPHIAFGRGIHACIGAQLARLEMRLALASLVKRLPGLRFADEDPELNWVPSLASRGLEELRISHDAVPG
jgi:cytochrome P450